MGLGKTRDFSRTSAQAAAQLVLSAGPNAAASPCKPPRPPAAKPGALRPDLAADLASEMEELRGPARLFYDSSNWPASYQYSLAASLERSVEVASMTASRSASRAEDRSSVTSASEGSATTRPRVFRKQPRVCVMCDHCWRASIPESRLYVLKCPKCLSDQPGDESLTGAEFRAMADKCAEVMAEREAKAAERRKSRLAERARLRMYDQPWTPQLANANNRELALAFERE